MPAIGKGSRRGLRARLSEAQQGPAGQPHQRAFDFELTAPRAPQNSFLQAVTLRIGLMHSFRKQKLSKLRYLFFRRRSKSADIE